jgi:very-short-patch-repair endonuclease
VSETNKHDDLSVVGLLEFLSELDSTRNPPVYDISSERIYEIADSDLPDVPGVALTPTDAAWLSVEYLDLPVVPSPPTDAAGALPTRITTHDAPDVIDGDALVEAERRKVAVAQGVSLEEATVPAARAAELYAASEAAAHWVANVWRPWSEVYRATEQAKILYRDLFAQQARLSTDRDSVEFVWGFGKVRWSTSEGVLVNAPLLAVPVEVELDSATQTLHVRPDGDIEVQVEYLASLSLHDRPGLLATRDSVLATGLDPWGEDARATLRTLVRHLHLEGVVVGGGAAQPNAPVLTPGWVLYMRRRRPNYQKFLADLRELYRNGADVPLPLQGVVLDAPTLPSGEAHNSAPIDPLLLPLAANEEQLQILRLAQEPSGVVVQGPPGTGKTHTIANLISHYVAYGKRVLVLAEKERALREVSGKVPAGIRDLTVSVLGADEQSRRQLGQSISVIQARVSGLDRDAADTEIVRVTAELAELDRSIAVTTTELLRSRELETQTLTGDWAPEAPVTPQRAAEWVQANEEQLRRIPDRLSHASSCPISASELAQLVRLVTDIGPDRAARALEVLTALDELPRAAELATWHTSVATAEEQLAAASERVTDWSALDAIDPQSLQPLLNRAAALARALEECQRGWLAVVTTQLRDPLLAPEWQRCVTEITSARERVITLRSPLAGHDVVLPGTLEDQFAAGIDRAVEALADGGKVGLFARAAKAALAQCRIDERPATTHEHATLVQTAIAAARARRALVTRWANQVVAVGGPALSPTAPEVEVREALDMLRSCVWLDAGWADLRRDLAALHVDVASTATPQEAAEVLAALNVLPARVAQRQARGRIEALAAMLAAGADQTGASGLWSLLADTVRNGATQRYAELRDEVAALTALRSQAEQLRELRDRLASAAPIWAQQLMTDPTAAGDPTTLELAWQWRQLDAWVSRVLETVEPGVLQRRLHDHVEQRHRVVGQLVTQRAWRRLADNLGDRERRGLNTYLQAVTRYGKTGGKYEARRAAEIRRAMDECKNAVPVWVMTSARALTSFQPEAVPPFDVLILDEASQAGYQALPLLSLAKQVIVVGDEKQTSPENVGLDRARVFEIMEDHLRSVRGYRTLFDPDNSLYDIARQRFTKSVMLVEHFRCLPDIIKFSNTRFYNDEIQPLRDRAPMLDWQPLGAVRVLDGHRSGDVNQPEAEAIVELLARLDADPRYDGMSFGVVTLLSGGQAQFIDTLLLDRLSPERYRARDLQVGEAAAFQGAERDVMVISLVVAPDPNNPTKGPAAATREADYRRLNVAASRAKQQLWVAYSVEPERFHANDMRGELIRHCRDPHAVDSGGADTLRRCDSEFERRVASHILSRGFRRLFAQYAVGSESRNYRIDLVVEGRSGRLAIECDGERWHGPDRWHADHIRQQVLERAGWTFERIRGSAFFRDEARALEPLWRRLAELDITAGEDRDGTAPQGQVFEVVGGTWRTPDGEIVAPATVAPRSPVAATVSQQPAPAGTTHAGASAARNGTSPDGAPPTPLPDPVPIWPAADPSPEASGAVGAPSTPGPAPAGPVVVPAQQHHPSISPSRPRSARDAILLAAYRVMARSGRDNFTASEVLEEMVAAGTTYAEGTIKTMISSHMVGDGSLDRVERGVYRVSSRVIGSTAGRANAAVHEAQDVESPNLPGPAASARPATLTGHCLACGKDGLIANTLCRRCRNTSE